MSELLWLAVPGGTAKDGVVVLRALMVPRLTADAPSILADFGLTDWPALLNASTLSVELGTAPDDPGTPVEADIEHSANSDIWRALFSPTMPVNPFRQRSYESPETPRTSELAGRIADSYGAAAVAYASDTLDPAVTVRTQYAGWRDDAPPSGVPGALAPQDWQKPDFHKAVSFLREHPEVLRRLGLNIAFSIKVENLGGPAATARLIRLRFVPGPGIDLPPSITPWTEFQFDGSRFLPATPPGGDLRSGMVDLTGAGLIHPNVPIPAAALPACATRPVHWAPRPAIPAMYRCPCCARPASASCASAAVRCSQSEPTMAAAPTPWPISPPACSPPTTWCWAIALTSSVRRAAGARSRGGLPATKSLKAKAATLSSSPITPPRRGTSRPTPPCWAPTGCYAPTRSLRAGRVGASPRHAPPSIRTASGAPTPPPPPEPFP
jgi:hypothetical protein